MLGGGVIQLGVERIDDELLTAIRALPAVNGAHEVAPPAPPSATDGGEPAAIAGAAAPEERLIKIESKRSQDALVEVIGYLNNRGIAFTSVKIFEPNLESVFLHLTGKKLRE
jgi:ABC-2 type transport system ATP-binding protein